MGRALRSGRLVGGTVYGPNSGLLFLGALDRRFYFMSSGGYEVDLDLTPKRNEAHNNKCNYNRYQIN